MHYNYITLHLVNEEQIAVDPSRVLGVRPFDGYVQLFYDGYTGLRTFKIKESLFELDGLIGDSGDRCKLFCDEGNWGLE